MPAVSNFVTKDRLRDTYFSSVVAWLGLRYVTQSPSLRRVNCENDTTVFGSIPIGTDVFIYGKGQSTRVRRRRSKLNWTSRTWSFTRVSSSIRSKLQFCSRKDSRNGIVIANTRASTIRPWTRNVRYVLLLFHLS